MTDEVRHSYPTVESLFDDFPTLFEVKLDANDMFPLWRDEEARQHYNWICRTYIERVRAWQEKAEPILKQFEKKAHQYDLQKTTKELAIEKNIEMDSKGGYEVEDLDGDGVLYYRGVSTDWCWFKLGNMPQAYRNLVQSSPTSMEAA